MYADAWVLPGQTLSRKQGARFGIGTPTSTRLHYPARRFALHYHVTMAPMCQTDDSSCWVG